MALELASRALPTHLARTAADALLWARYFAAHEAIRLPLIGLHRLAFALPDARNRAATTPRARDRALEQFVQRRYRQLLERDFANARRGLYPTELLFDLPLGEYLARVPRFVLDAPRVLERIRARAHRDLPAHVDLEGYPHYYRRTFHWQTDGYLSHHSALLYDLSVEFLFIGCADVMRRQALAEVARKAPPRPLRVLDVGAGTGRFLAQAALSLPGARLAGIELSPWYARFAEGEWAADPRLRGLRMVVGNAEALPFADASFDVVTSIFMLHELPRRVRRTVLAEVHRVLAPGGLLVLEDAAQPRDSAPLAPALRQFSVDMHEPFFMDYQADDLEELLAECGFRVESCAPHFVSKVVSARR